MKLNKNEVKHFTNISIDRVEDLNEAGRILLDTFATGGILITLGPRGMAYFDQKKYRKHPFKIVDNPMHIYDVCGAGDVVISVLAFLMTDKHINNNIELILKYAAKAGKIAVSKKGTSTIDKLELFSGANPYECKC
jgi:bifunctional ADP-heptose synthase (sugar kinase/adenylyltransferase)